MEEIVIGTDTNLFTAILKMYNLFRERGWCTEQEARRAAWDFLESVSDDTFSGKLSKIRTVLFPQSEKTPVITISPGAFSLIAEEAKRLYENTTDATDQERTYWRALSRGILPKWMQIN